MKILMISMLFLFISQVSLASGGVTTEESFDCAPTSGNSKNLIRFTMANLPAGWQITSDVLVYPDKDKLRRMKTQLAECLSSVYATKEISSKVKGATLTCGNRYRHGNQFRIKPNDKGWYGTITVTNGKGREDGQVKLNLYNKNANKLSEAKLETEYSCMQTN